MKNINKLKILIIGLTSVLQFSNFIKNVIVPITVLETNTSMVQNNK